MRVVLLSLLLSFSVFCFAQINFDEQLNSIIKDSTSRFKNFRTGFKYQSGNDSVFHSTFNLEGTADNTVSISNDESTYIVDYYTADVAKSIPEKQGKKIADEWKSKVLAIVGNSFQLTRLNSKKYSSEYGWQFERGFFWIDIAYIPRKKETGSLLLLQISYAHLREIIKN